MGIPSEGGMQKTSDALKKHADVDDKMTLQITDSLGRLQETYIINEKRSINGGDKKSPCQKSDKPMFPFQIFGGNRIVRSGNRISSFVSGCVLSCHKKTLRYGVPEI